jgi:hypothetical protein
MMSPQVYEDARARAPMHVQLIRVGTLQRPEYSGCVRIRGRIVRIFRDREHQLHWGQRVSLCVSVIDRSRSEPPTLSGTIYHDGERLGRARWLEAFLESWHGEIQLVRSQLIVIRHPTLQPVCGPDAKGFLPIGDRR